MNIKEKKIIVDSIGILLKNARKNLKMTQLDISKKLFLKISIIKDIEENKHPKNLALTFFRGYIRAYARLVHVPEEELQCLLSTEELLDTYKNIPIKMYLSKLHQKKTDRWLEILLTIIVCCILFSFTGFLWWKNNIKLKNDFIFTTNKSFVLNEKKN